MINGRHGRHREKRNPNLRIGLSQVAERLGNWASNQKVAGLIPGFAK